MDGETLLNLLLVLFFVLLGGVFAGTVGGSFSNGHSGQRHYDMP